MSNGGIGKFSSFLVFLYRRPYNEFSICAFSNSSNSKNPFKFAEMISFQNFHIQSNIFFQGSPSKLRMSV
ncbi:hypothetical protein T12_7719 [Trichinella patagoniensis]|uniref:Uncharacterized protein n=1 Tax=Trichinella patagoniensis TaxID=990121 RepID=A0A0V0YPT2_9BILA|nr:hypothetical protein T12_7719 [Trichinella patagoniensis]